MRLSRRKRSGLLIGALIGIVLAVIVLNWSEIRLRWRTWNVVTSVPKGTTYDAALDEEIQSLGGEAIPHFGRIATETGNDRWTRRVATHALGVLRDPATIPYLRRCAQDPDELIRTDAILALGMTETEEAIRIVLQHADDPSIYVRAYVCTALWFLRDKLDPETLNRALRSKLKDPDPFVRDAARDALDSIREMGNRSRTNGSG